jgi:hypothetical protein
MAIKPIVAPMSLQSAWLRPRRNAVGRNRISGSPLRPARNDGARPVTVHDAANCESVSGRARLRPSRH